MEYRHKNAQQAVVVQTSSLEVNNMYKQRKLGAPYANIFKFVRNYYTLYS